MNKPVNKAKDHHPFDGPLRRETWIHPEGGLRIHRTAMINPMTESDLTSDDDELRQIDSTEVKNNIKKC